MARKGEATKALGLGIVFSLLGGLFSFIILIFMAPPLARIALRFSAIEYFAVTIFALTMIATISSGNMLVGMLSGMLGLIISPVGLAPIDGLPRFNFGFENLTSGFDILPTLIGIFVISEALATAESINATNNVKPVELKPIKGFGFEWSEFGVQKWNFLRSSLIGTGIGILPGIGGITSGILAYIDATIHQAQQYETLGMLSSSNGPHYIGSGGYGYTTRLAPRMASGVGARMADMWGYVANQIFTSVSPEMTLESAIEHERKWAELWGMVYYGCCERLDHKLSELRQLPKLRKVSMPPYANLEEGMEKMGSNMVVSFKPNSNYLANPAPDFEFLRRELLHVCKLARKYGCQVEILMKTIITLQGEPQRLWQWCEMAREIVSHH